MASLKNFIYLFVVDTFEKAHNKARKSVKGIESSDLETPRRKSRRNKELSQPTAVPTVPSFNLGKS